MGMTTVQQQAAVDNQVKAWKEELPRESVRIADLLAAPTGVHHAAVLVSGTGQAYADVVPELILKDVLRVNPYSWPKGFRIDLLNPTN